MEATNTSKKKGTRCWGANTETGGQEKDQVLGGFLLQLGGTKRNWVGNYSPSVYVKRSPAIGTATDHLLSAEEEIYSCIDQESMLALDARI